MNDPWDDLDEDRRREGVEAARDFIWAVIIAGSIAAVIAVVIWML